MMLYICARNNQCVNPCGCECYYTSNFFNSKLFNDKIKPKDPITFIKDKNNNFWEMNPDPNWDNNLPESLRVTPLTLIHRSYDQLVQEDISNKKESWNKKF